MSTLQEFLDTTARVLETCQVEVKGGLAYLSTPLDGLAPWIVVQEQATALLAFTELGEEERAQRLVRALLALQHPKGYWTAIYRPDGTPVGPPAVAGSAAVTWALLTYARTNGSEAVASVLAPRVRRALQVLTEHLHPQLDLPFVPSDVLPPAYSAGFSLWTAALTVAVFRQAGELYNERDYTDRAGLVRAAIERYLTQEDRFITRLTPQGIPDPRPTIALLAPALFEVWEATDPLLAKSRALVERTLVDRQIGGLCPFLVYTPGENVALPGVWPTATAWFARYLYLAGEREGGDKLLRRLLNSVVGGAMPQAILTPELLTFVRNQKHPFLNGTDHTSGRTLMRRLLDDLTQQAKERTFLYAISPSFAAHMETLRAFAAGGYVRSFAPAGATVG